MESHDGVRSAVLRGCTWRLTAASCLLLPRERVQVSANTSTGTQHRVDGVKAFSSSSSSFFCPLAKESQRRKAKV